MKSTYWSCSKLADRIRGTSKLEGKLEGEKQIAQRLLEEGSDPGFVAKVTGLSLDKIKMLQKH